MNIKNSVKTGINRLYERTTLRGFFFFLQVLVVIGWVVCLTMADLQPTLDNHWMEAARVHCDICIALCLCVVTLNFTKFGRMKIFQQISKHNAKD